MSTLSVFIVTKDEENNIKRCLESVKWADEIIVVDSKSTDKTVEICKEYTNKVIIDNWKGCGPQKKQAFDLTTCEWVLNIDADEVLTKELQEEIKSSIKDEKYSGYKIPFQSYYCGKKIKYGDWANEKHLRLFKKSKGDIIPNLIHFGVKVNGEVKTLKNKIMHYSFTNLSQVINKMNMYSSYGALNQEAKGKKSSFTKAVLHGFWTFIRGYFLRLGFLDGKEGFMLAVSNSEGCYYKYLKLALK